MLRSIFVTLLGFTLIFSITACGGSDKVSKKVAAVVPNMASHSLQGNWSMVDPEKGFDMTAKIKDGKISIDWYTNPESHAIYWIGTFITDKAKDGDTIKSVGDRETLDVSLMGSGAEDKTFTYKNGTLDFELTVVGVTRMIHLEKNS